MQTFESDQEMGLGGAANDDWGDFSTVISQLESDERALMMMRHRLWQSQHRA